jgi:hypothetical protein
VNPERHNRKEVAMSNSSLKELAYREQDGLEIALLWDPRSNDVCVDVVDDRGDSFLRIPVAARFALDAFRHPYAYARADESSGERSTQAARAE